MSTPNGDTGTPPWMYKADQQMADHQKILQEREKQRVLDEEAAAAFLRVVALRARVHKISRIWMILCAALFTVFDIGAHATGIWGLYIPGVASAFGFFYFMDDYRDSRPW